MPSSIPDGILAFVVYFQVSIYRRSSQLNRNKGVTKEKAAPTFRNEQMIIQPADDQDITLKDSTRLVEEAEMSAPVLSSSLKACSRRMQREFMYESDSAAQLSVGKHKEDPGNINRAIHQNDEGSEDGNEVETEEIVSSEVNGQIAEEDSNATVVDMVYILQNERNPRDEMRSDKTNIPQFKNERPTTQPKGIAAAGTSLSAEVTPISRSLQKGGMGTESWQEDFVCSPVPMPDVGQIVVPEEAQQDGSCPQTVKDSYEVEETAPTQVTQDTGASVVDDQEVGIRNLRCSGPYHQTISSVLDYSIIIGP